MATTQKGDNNVKNNRELSKQQMTELEHQLLQERANYISEHPTSEKISSGELSTLDNHPADTASELYEREKDMAIRAHNKQDIKDIDLALEAIQNNTYGQCKICGQPISYERLQANPTALYCVEHSPHAPREQAPEQGNRAAAERLAEGASDDQEAWDIVAEFGNASSPALEDDPEQSYYNHFDETEGFVESIESFLASDINGDPIDFLPNEASRTYKETLDEEDTE